MKVETRHIDLDFKVLKTNCYFEQAMCVLNKCENTMPRSIQ